MWPLQKKDQGTSAGRDCWTLWTSIGRSDRLSDGGLSPAPARGGSAAGAGSGNPDQLWKYAEGGGRSGAGAGCGNPDQLGKYAEVLERSQCGRSRPLSGTGTAIA